MGVSHTAVKKGGSLFHGFWEGGVDSGRVADV